MDDRAIEDLVDHIQIDRRRVIFFFKCPNSAKIVRSEIPFEPYEGAIVLEYKDILLHPIASYKRYYHTPITIYTKDSSSEKTLMQKAFKEVADLFLWSPSQKSYICRDSFV